MNSNETGYQPPEPGRQFFDREPTNPLLESVAQTLTEYSLDIQAGDKLLILMHHSGWQLATEVVKIARTKGAEVLIRLYDPEIAKIALEGMNNQFSLPLNVTKNSTTPLSAEEQRMAFIQAGLGNDQLDAIVKANKFLIIRNKIAPTESYEVKVEDQTAYDHIASMLVRFRNDDPDKRWTLIYEPNEQEAELAGLSLDEYRDMYYSAINRPWEEVHSAQDVLIDFLANKKYF